MLINMKMKRVKSKDVVNGARKVSQEKKLDSSLRRRCDKGRLDRRVSAGIGNGDNVNGDNRTQQQ